MQPIAIADHMAGVHSDIRGDLYVEAMKMQAAGDKILKLNSGNPGVFGFTMPASVKEALLAGADRAVPYSDFRGMPAARQAIRAYHESRGVRDFDEDDIFLGNGVSEIASMLTEVMLNPGDEMLLPAPCYPLWSNCTRIAGGKPVFYTCDESNNWQPDVDEMERLITPRTRGILLINPNNPTGAVYGRDVLERVVALAQKYRLPILSDEIYDHLVYQGTEMVSAASLAPKDVTVITLNGLSKSHYLCGFRCGWMVVSGAKVIKQPLLDAVIKVASLRLCPNALMQLVVPAALNDTRDIDAAMAPGGRLFEQRKATIEQLSRIDGISVVPNHGAFYVFPRIDIERFGITSGHDFCMELLHEKKIMLVPGSGFECEDENHIRIVMLPQADAMAKAIADIGDFLEHKKRALLKIS